MIVLREGLPCFMHLLSPVVLSTILGIHSVCSECLLSCSAEKTGTQEVWELLVYRDGPDMVLFLKCQHLERECVNLVCNTGHSAPSNCHPNQAPGQTHLHHRQTLLAKSTECSKEIMMNSRDNENISEKCKHYKRRKKKNK